VINFFNKLDKIITNEKLESNIISNLTNISNNEQPIGGDGNQSNKNPNNQFEDLDFQEVEEFEEVEDYKSNRFDYQEENKTGIPQIAESNYLFMM